MTSYSLLAQDTVEARVRRVQKLKLDASAKILKNLTPITIIQNNLSAEQPELGLTTRDLETIILDLNS